MKKSLGKYRLIAEIGRGGMATVYLASAEGLGGFSKVCVIKEPTFEQLEDDADTLAMFLDEARLAARLNHSNIVQTYEVGEDEGRFFIAMQYLEGQPLHRIRSRLAKDGALDLPLQLRILVDVLVGLHYAHELRDFDGSPLHVVHRDVSPQNIFVTYDGHTKLVDFGIAKATGSSAHTQEGVLKGKVKYMSPEQVDGDPIDRRADIWAVGVILWEIATESRIYVDKSDMAILTSIMRQEIPRAREVKPDIEPAIEAIIERAMAVDPNHRYQTALEMQNDIEAYLHQHPRRVTTRDVGQLVAHHFATDRSRQQNLVELHLRDHSMLSTADSLPRIVPPDLSSKPSMVRPPVISNPDDEPTITTPQTATALAANLSAQTQAASPTTTKSKLWIAGAVGAVAALAAILLLTVPSWRLFVSEESAPATEPTASREDESTTDDEAGDDAEQTANAKQIVLEITTEPADCRIFLDDALLATGSYSGRLRKDGRAYRVRVTKPGYVSAVRIIEASGDHSLAIALEEGEDDDPEPVIVVPKPPAGRVPTGTQTDDFKKVGDGRKPGALPVDTSDPYK